jgi:predicted permease
MTEAAILASAGGISGVLLAAGIVALARLGLAGLVPRAEAIALNGAALAFALGLCVFTALIFGIAPLWHLRAAQSTEALRSTGRSSTGDIRGWLRAALAVTQVALATLLLVGAGLLLQSFAKLQAAPLGFEPEGVTTARITVPRARYQTPGEAQAMLARLVESLQASPEVSAAGITTSLPLSGDAYPMTRGGVDESRMIEVQWRLVDSGYFRSLAIPVLRGRPFDANDGAGSERVFIVSQTLARALYGDADPVGRTLHLELGGKGVIVGIAGDVRLRSAAQPAEPAVYMPLTQFGFFPVYNIVVDGPAPAAAAELIRTRLREIDATLPAYNVRLMADGIGRHLAPARIRTWLLTALGGVAFLISAIGVYGVISYLVTSRRREFGVRMAVGARPFDLFADVVGHGVRLFAFGIAAGLAAAYGAASALESLLFGILARDPATFVLVAAVVLVTALAASSVPAWRAAHANPLEVLRSE